MFNVDIVLGNDAMQTAADVAEALRRLADRLEAYSHDGALLGRIYDTNGNCVGSWECVGGWKDSK